ncbi:MAG: hypothetical protein IPP61_11000 [Cytophagaceae bacterium]|nr:hypothetical protein [Cytophagaceae bacterium]MBK9933421.1 hypothetical protein [Cytophagaceae bacterium]MBL0302862.1 hypothetical protein [Cytophagaceae bacterium]MBL0325692.1 hypothetical protein [Cytophagaceae bacterium]
MFLKIYNNELSGDWDDFEYYPIIKENDFCEECEIGEESFWSVFVHLKEGGLACIADVPNQSDALRLISFLKVLQKNNKNQVINNFQVSINLTVNQVFL